MLPTDVRVADKFDKDANDKVVPVNAIPDGWMVREAGASWPPCSPLGCLKALACLLVVFTVCFSAWIMLTQTSLWLPGLERASAPWALPLPPRALLPPGLLRKTSLWLLLLLLESAPRFAAGFPARAAPSTLHPHPRPHTRAPNAPPATHLLRPLPPPQGLDVGPESIEHITKVLGDCKTVLWNGPLGVFEFPKFAAGTFAVAQTLAEITAKGERSARSGAGRSMLSGAQHGGSARSTHSMLAAWSVSAWRSMARRGEAEQGEARRSATSPPPPPLSQPEKRAPLPPPNPPAP